MKTEPFSLLCDESTDRTCVKQLAVVVRLVNEKIEVEDTIFSLVEVTDCTAQGIYDIITKQLCVLDIPYKQNLVGFAADGANVMMGSTNSVKTRIESDCPNIFTIKCISHSLHLCASSACTKLPDYLEKLIRNISAYFNSSPKRTNELKAYQELWELNPNKMLHPSATRWLSLVSCVNRVIKHYIPLKGYFKVQANIDQITNAKEISEALDNPVTLIYLHFLSYFLPYFTNLNLEMQSEEIKIHVIADRIQTFVKTFLEVFVKSECMTDTDVSDVDFLNPENFLPLD